MSIEETRNCYLKPAPTFTELTEDKMQDNPLSLQVLEDL
jgi:hypothetical protein